MHTQLWKLYSPYIVENFTKGKVLGILTEFIFIRLFLGEFLVRHKFTMINTGLMLTQKPHLTYGSYVVWQQSLQFYSHNHHSFLLDFSAYL